MTTRTNPLLALAADPSGRSLGLGGLPRGTFFRETLQGTWPEPLLWRADEAPERDAWARLLPACRGAGLHPVLLGGEDGEPWYAELAPEGGAEEPGAGAGAVLREWWERYAAPEGDGGARGRATEPFGARWPGLAAPAEPAGEDPDDVAARVVGALLDFQALTAPRMGLVPARRGADVPAAIGWTGPVNHGSDPVPYRTVLRSWEDRFGARVVALEFDVLHVAVANPPRTVEEALPLAAEHFAFCPDNIWRGAGSLTRYAGQQVLGKRHWSFWWD